MRWCRWAGASGVGQGVEVAEGVDAGEPAAAEPATSDDELLVEAVAVGARDDETRVADDADVARLEDFGQRWDGASGDAGEAASPG